MTGIFLAFALVELAQGRLLHRARSGPRDVVLDVACALAIPLLIVPAIFTAAPALAEALVPGSAGALADLPVVVMFVLLLIGDDLSQYLWHRLSHSSWLYPLHRAHHSARYLSVRVVYRNNLVYYALMPSLWISALLVHGGFGAVYPVYIIAKMLVITGAHSSVPWDAALYRRAPRLMWVVERLISTPATHAAHHGLHEADGVTHYRGNYGNFLFLWDVLFGTAHITRRRPADYGIEGLEPVPLWAELLVPLPARPSPAARDSVHAPRHHPQPPQ